MIQPSLLIRGKTGGEVRNYGLGESWLLKVVMEPASSAAVLRLFHWGMVRNTVDVHKGELLSEARCRTNSLGWYPRDFLESVSFNWDGRLSDRQRDYGRIRLGRSERKFSLVRSFLVCDLNRTPNCYGKTWRFLCPFFRNLHLRENLARNCFTSTLSTVTNSVQKIFTHLRYCDK